MAAQKNFQWQNDILLKDIYPMRLVKLRDVLVFFKEADLWAEYKDKNIATLTADVAEYKKGMEAARKVEIDNYSKLKTYFLAKDVSGAVAKLKPVEPEAMALIHKNHDLFVASWPKDIRGERGFIQSRIESFKLQLGFLFDLSNLFTLLFSGSFRFLERYP